MAADLGVDQAEIMRRALLAGHLHRLESYQEWDIYVEQVKEREQQVVDKLIASGAEAEYHRGYIRALRDCLALPQILIAQARRL